MSLKRSIDMVANKGSFDDAEELEIEYYASIDWKESARNVERMRRMIWGKEYSLKPDRNVVVAGLYADRNA